MAKIDASIFLHLVKVDLTEICYKPVRLPSSNDRIIKLGDHSLFVDINSARALVKALHEAFPGEINDLT